MLRDALVGGGVQVWKEIAAVVETGAKATVAKLEVAVLRLVHRGAVGRVRHVDGDAHLRVNAVRARVGAAEADLFLQFRRGANRAVFNVPQRFG